jgi:hypothetical protein
VLQLMPHRRPPSDWAQQYRLVDNEEQFGPVLPIE